MTLNNVIFCLSFGMLSYMFIGNAFAKVLTEKDANGFLKAMDSRKQTELDILDKDGYTEIADEAFRYLPENGILTKTNRLMRKVVSLNIPSTIETIGKEAFSYLPKLETVNIAEGVAVIGDLAFFGCKALNQINIPTSVTRIGEKAFANCKTLKEINIPNTILDMKKYAFANCTSLKKATFQDGDQVNWKLKDIRGTFLGCTSLEDVRLPNTLETIGMHTFCQCSNLRSITIPDGVKSIHYAAFKECTNLTEVTMYSSIMSIENNIFEGCPNLKVIKVLGVTDKPNQERIEELLKRSGMPIGTTIKFDSKQVTLRNRSESTTINKRNSEPVNLWSNSSYQNDNKSRKRNSLPVESSSKKDSTSKKSKTHSRSKSADYSTTNYVDTSSKKSKSFVKVTSSRSNIQSNVITSQAYGNVLTRDIVYANLKKEFVIPEGYTTIEPRAFEGRNVTSITIPMSMTVIGPNAFSGCTSLKTLKIHQKVTAIDVNAFTGCQGVAVQILYDGTNLPKADIDNIESIFRQPFNGGYWKRDWVASTSVEAKNTGTASQSAVRNDLVTAGVVNSLTRNNGELVIPEGYTSIDANAFYGKQNINSITIPMSMTVIGPNAFSGCTSLKTLKIHPKVTGIDVNAFTGCQGVAVQVLYDGTNLPKADIDKIESIFGQTFNGGYWKRDWIAK